MAAASAQTAFPAIRGGIYSAQSAACGNRALVYLWGAQASYPVVRQAFIVV